MPGIINNSLGNITIADDIVATVAGYATVENYGIVGMASKKAGEGLWELLGRGNARKGVRVAITENACVIDLFVIVEYGVSLSAVAQNVIENVTYRVHDTTGLDVSSVNVHVEGVRVQQA